MHSLILFIFLTMTSLYSTNSTASEDVNEVTKSFIESSYINASVTKISILENIEQASSTLNSDEYTNRISDGSLMNMEDSGVFYLEAVSKEQQLNPVIPKTTYVQVDFVIPSEHYNNHVTALLLIDLQGVNAENVLSKYKVPSPNTYPRKPKLIYPLAVEAGFEDGILKKLLTHSKKPEEITRLSTLAQTLLSEKRATNCAELLKLAL